MGDRVPQLQALIDALNNKDFRFINPKVTSEPSGYFCSVISPHPKRFFLGHDARESVKVIRALYGMKSL